MREPGSARRIRWLEAQLEEYEPATVAAVGGRIRAAIGPWGVCDPYERALTITLDVLQRRGDLSAARDLVRRVSSGSSRAMQSLGHLVLEPAA